VQELLLWTNGSGGMAQLLKNHLGETPLFLAIEKGNTAIVRAIAQACYDHIFVLNLQDKRSNHTTAIQTHHLLYNDN
jgi:hypothetical protein